MWVFFWMFVTAWFKVPILTKKNSTANSLFMTFWNCHAGVVILSDDFMNIIV